ncbi:MAG: hypothetical protein HQ579_05375 [Candidatus Omnitrophica bacterium]|nr:hypothetical protein [Candidatus Omnitrophota bacterium]
MEKVKCIKCGSVGYTAASDSVRCYKCGGRHKIIPMTSKKPALLEEESIHYLQGLPLGDDEPGSLCRD